MPESPPQQGQNLHYQCPLRPKCQKVFAFSPTAHQQLIELSLRKHLDIDHIPSDFIEEIERLRDQLRLATGLIQDVQVMFVAVQRVGDRIGVFNKVHPDAGSSKV